MFELVQLEQLLAIKKYETLSNASQKLLISQPALSRSMQRLEDELQVPLFTRTKNKIQFNENGLLALEYAKRIVESSIEMKEHLQSFYKSKHTISIGSVAPAPMWDLTPKISMLFPDTSIQSEMKPIGNLITGIKNDNYQILITTEEIILPSIISKKYCNENLMVSLPPAHPLATYKSLSLGDLNGESILVWSKVGFWFDICKEKMPDSLFLVQDELSILDELRRSSALPAFASNFTNAKLYNEHRVLIPLTDTEVNVTFYISYNKKYKDKFSKIS